MHGLHYRYLDFFVGIISLFYLINFFKYSDQNKNSESLNTIQEQSNIVNQSKDLSITNLRKLDIEEKQEWIQRRERLRQIIGLDRVDFPSMTKKTTVESMLKTQRDNFGITMPILGQFVRKYMQHRSRTNFDQVQIHGGKVRINFIVEIIFSIIYFFRQLFIHYYH